MAAAYAGGKHGRGDEWSVRPVNSAGQNPGPAHCDVTSLLTSLEAIIDCKNVFLVFANIFK